jgi:dTDP-4-amino-4,6-dideoxygalactose transaminase
MIRLSKSIVGEKEANAVKNVIENVGYLGMGYEVQMFENELEDYIGNSKYKCACVNTGTSALHLAIEAIASPGDEVLVPSFTYVATFQAITAAGCVPIACDVRKDDLLLDIIDAEKRITSKTKIIMNVLYASNTNNIDDVYLLAKKYNLRVIEDAAHAFGCTHNGIKIGGKGDIICFSFDGIKNITSGEGGAIFSSDENVINRVKDTRLLGVIKDSDNRFKGKRSWDFDVINQGHRFHMSNIFAAIGRVQLKRFESEFSPIRKLIARKYIELLSENKDVRFLKINYEFIVPHIFPILINKNKRNVLITSLKDNNIQFGMHYKPNHLLKRFRINYSLKICESSYNEIITLPIHPEISNFDIEKICKIINNI